MIDFQHHAQRTLNDQGDDLDNLASLIGSMSERDCAVNAAAIQTTVSMLTLHFEVGSLPALEAIADMFSARRIELQVQRGLEQLADSQTPIIATKEDGSTVEMPPTAPNPLAGA